MKKLRYKIKKSVINCTTYIAGDILSNFRFYRKKMGGIWYLVFDDSGAGGFAGTIQYWTQTPPEPEIGISIIEKEKYF